MVRIEWPRSLLSEPWLPGLPSAMWARALDVPYGDVDRIAKMIPAELGVTIDRSLEISADLALAYQNDYDTRRIIDIARAIEGMPRHASIHAAGVVIGRESSEFIVAFAEDQLMVM